MTTLSGIMLTPGVSGNGRLYTPELMAKAFDRLSERLTDGEALPVTMMTHHAAGDDSTEIVGHLTAIEWSGDNIAYTAELADTLPSKTIENLVKPGPDGKPSLKSVSIRGWWLGPVETKTIDGRQVTTADDLEIDGLDFTKNPGVAGASVAIVADPTTTESAGRTLITETVTARVQFTETVQEATVPDAKPSHTFADLGYQPDKIKRFPIGDQAAAETSWKRIGQPEVSETYTAPQIKRIKGRIREALRSYGATVAETSDAHVIAEHEVKLSDVTECYDCYDSTGTAGFSISAYNGPLTVSVSAYRGIEPEQLAGIATAAMQAAIDAVHAMDPDDDGDIDTGTSDAGTGGGSMESTTQPKEATVAETKAPEAAPTKPADAGKNAAAAESAPITQAQLAEAVQAAVAAALATKTATGETADTDSTDDKTGTEESASTATPIDEAALRKSIEEDVTKKLIAEMRANGTLGRKGLVQANLGEATELTKQPHEMTTEEFTAYRNGLLENFVPIG